MTETFGQRFARLRKAKGFTQDEISEKVNVSSQAVSKWENDINMPDVGILLHLAEILGVTTDELLGKEMPLVARFEPEKGEKDMDSLMFKIVVDSSDGDKVRVNLPFKLVKLALNSESKPTFASSGKMGEKLSDIDWQQVISMVEQGLLGEIITVESADGDHVRVFVE